MLLTCFSVIDIKELSKYYKICYVTLIDFCIIS